jgi:hypothetical protein
MYLYLIIVIIRGANSKKQSGNIRYMQRLLTTMSGSLQHWIPPQEVKIL